MTGEQIVKRFGQLEQERAPFEAIWRELAEYIQPRKSEVLKSRGRKGGTVRSAGKLYDNTGLEANKALARGQLAWMTPKQTPWFNLKPGPEIPGAEDDEDAKDWCADATDRMFRALQNSNFYTEIHECYLDRGGFGTADVFSDFAGEGDEWELWFKCYPVGTFVCAENAKGIVDTVGCKHVWTHRQAYGEFGDALPEEVRKKAGSPAQENQTHEYIHLVFPRPKNRRKSLPLSMGFPFASVWVHVPTKTIIRESGFHEMPHHVTRFLRWASYGKGDSPYGQSPAYDCLAEMRQLNKLENTMDGLADQFLNPPLQVPDGLDSRIDLRPGGMNVYDPTLGPDAGIKEIITKAEYKVGLERAEQKRRRVNDAFMVSLFQMFQQLEDRQRTAMEIRARLDEKIDQFNPTFDLLSTELLQPLIKRVFRLMLRAGKFKPIPQSLLVRGADGKNRTPEPRIEFSSRIALAFDAAKHTGALRSLVEMEPLVALQGDLLDNLDTDEVFRDNLMTGGAPVKWLRKKADVDSRRKKRAELQQQQMLAQAA